jgi:hypothetical protein
MTRAAHWPYLFALVLVVLSVVLLNHNAAVLENQQTLANNIQKSTTARCSVDLNSNKSQPVSFCF